MPDGLVQNPVVQYLYSQSLQKLGQRTHPPGTNTQFPERKTHLGLW
jgi:hypothetical protein